MKIAPLWSEMKKHPAYFQPLIVHTGQHYDENMSGIFFEDLEIPKPDIYLGVGSGSHAEQTAKIMIEFEKVLVKERPDIVVLVGDVNSTLACSLVTSKIQYNHPLTQLPVNSTTEGRRPLIAHVEAGLRSFDRTMPEEINRIVTDSLSDFLFTTCEDANENLRKEGVPGEKIYFVGNVMIDTLLKFKAKAGVKAKIRIDRKDYAILTLHRASNVDNKEVFRDILETLKEVSKKIPIIFPAHPRTQKQIESFGYQKYFSFIDLNSMNSINPKRSINLLNPLPYIDFLNLMANAMFVLTDSGGIQEETTILGVPCLTLRKNTERPITITEGTNLLVGTDRDKIISESLNILNGGGKTGRIPKLWDGKAAERIVRILK